MRKKANLISFIGFLGEKVTKPLSRLRKCEEGVGAVEFALIVPMLLIIYVGAVEISVAMSVDKKVAKASAIASDLITQSSIIDKNTLGEMHGVAQAVLAPFDATDLELEVVGISVDSSGNATVAWSWDEDHLRPYPVGTPITIHGALLIPDTFLVQTTINLDHDVLLAIPEDASVGFMDRNIRMEKVYYLHQRDGEDIDCTDC